MQMPIFLDGSKGLPMKFNDHITFSPILDDNAGIWPQQCSREHQTGQKAYTGAKAIDVKG